jgi:threonine synthase
MRALHLQCVNCGEKVDLGLRYRCQRCDFPLEVVYDPPQPGDPLEVAGRGGVWRFEPLLPPVPPGDQVSLGEGNTPLLRSERLGPSLGLPGLYLKNEGLNPTGSFKDRPNCIGVSVARSLHVPTVVMSSTGNAGASMAAYAARAGIRALVFVTDRTPPAKLTQMAIHGAEMVVVKGTLSDAYWLAFRAARKWKWMDLTSTFLCPYTTEGDKTVAYELYQQLGSVPSYVVVPVSVGPLLIGIYKGFSELKAMGLVDRLPHLVAAQAAACGPIARAFAAGDEVVRPWDSAVQTVAGGIADPLHGYESDGTYTLRLVRQSDGFALAASEDEILGATRQLASQEGIFSEPTGAVAVAVLRQLVQQRRLSPDETVVCLVTGHGLKQTRAFEGDVRLPEAIEPTLEALEGLLAQS